MEKHNSRSKESCKADSTLTLLDLFFVSVNFSFSTDGNPVGGLWIEVRYIDVWISLYVIELPRFGVDVEGVDCQNEDRRESEL